MSSLGNERSQIHRSFIHNRDDVKNSEQSIVDVRSSMNLTPSQAQASIFAVSSPPVALGIESTQHNTSSIGVSHQLPLKPLTFVSTEQSQRNATLPQLQQNNVLSNPNTAFQVEKHSETKEESNGKKKKPKKDRSKLRKGKWTVEEEEYTSRIIHHFSTGLLTLPEGTTLRSYLAEKLNCDPMRITKKFAGASCLGKRVYHLCDRTQATVTDVEMAKAELSRLEHRFRLRVEHGQNGIPLPPRADAMPAIHGAPAVIYPQVHQAPPPVGVQWVHQIAAATQGAQSVGSLQPTAQHSHTVAAAPAQALPARAPPPATTGAPLWLAPIALAAASQSAPQTATIPSAPPNPAAAQPGGNMFALAWAQAAASLGPALSQLAAANLQKHHNQLQKAYESQVQNYSSQQRVTAPAPGAPVAAPAFQVGAPTIPTPHATQAPVHMTHQTSAHPTQHVHTPLPGYALAAPPPAHLTVVQPPASAVHSAPAKMAPPPNVSTSAQTFTRSPVVATAPMSTQQHIHQHIQHTQVAHAPSLQHSIIPAHSVRQPPITTNTAPVPVQVSAPPSAVASLQAAQQIQVQRQVQAQVAAQSQAQAQPDPPAPPQSSNSSALDQTAQPTALDPSAAPRTRSKEDEDAGSMLMGFITSLRKGFMAAKNQKDKEMQERKENSTGIASGATSHAADSSPDDSGASKDNSSSDDSDKDAEKPRGPPRKRMKKKRVIGEFTSKNVAAHNTRMDALHAKRQKTQQSVYQQMQANDTGTK